MFRSFLWTKNTFILVCIQNAKCLPRPSQALKHATILCSFCIWLKKGRVNAQKNRHNDVGSGARIGKGGIAMRLTEDGFNVVVNGSKDEAACQSVVSEIEANGGSAHFCMADIGQRSDIDRLIDSTHKHFGPVHVLINNAAIRPSAPFLDEDMAVWDKVMDVNFHSAVWLARGLLPDMNTSKLGSDYTFHGDECTKRLCRENSCLRIKACFVGAYEILMCRAWSGWCYLQYDIAWNISWR